MKNGMLVAVVLIALMFVAGCQVGEALLQTETVGIGRWVSETFDPETDGIKIEDGMVSITKPDGTVHSRTAPEAMLQEDTTALAGATALKAIQLALIEKKPIAAGVAVLEAVVLGAAALFFRKKKLSLRAVILGLKSATTLADSTSTSLTPVGIKAAIKKEAEVLGVETGMGSLSKEVKRLGADITA